MTGTLHYSSNNSGGSWWLKDGDWLALEAAGWTVEWYRDQDRKWFKPDAEGRWLGALASRAYKEFDNPDDGLSEWMNITDENPDDEGCNCCGAPHSFSFETSDGSTSYLDSRPSGYVRSWS